jgi:hypothetical protein
MLNGAKHLQYLLKRAQLQILRFAQDDSPWDVCHGLPLIDEPSVHLPICPPATRGLTAIPGLVHNFLSPGPFIP